MSRWMAFMIGLTLAACGSQEAFSPQPAASSSSLPSADSEPCVEQSPYGRALFGDLHVHTAFSADAYAFGVRATPDDAYRYAFGGEIRLPPYDDQKEGGRVVRIDRPLDFAAVTDHAEFLGEGRLCVDPNSGVFNASFCESYRAEGGRNPSLVFQIMSPFNWRNSEVCGESDFRCAEASSQAWRETIAAAERWNDTRPDCERTTFVAYEYSSHRLGSNLHRNVIFRNATVPSIPISYLEAQREWDLWESLDETCLSAGNGCDVLSIPHNPNISNGRMFAIDYPETSGLEEQRKRAALRARLEPIVEIMQHKGDSECRAEMPGVSAPPDELCAFEKFEDFAFRREADDPDPDLCTTGWLADRIPHLGPDCLSPQSYIRYALVTGLGEKERLGVNPFKFGLSASTDTHNGLAGGVRERDFPGHLGLGDDRPEERTQWDRSIPGNASNNPGGLIGVWAKENRRDAIFDAMKRREVFGTSGPRIRVRFFGSQAFKGNLCEQHDPVAGAYAQGVTMGSDLPTANDATSPPTFVTLATRDTGTPEQPGGRLQRIQIIKGWRDAQGELHGQVYDVAGDADNGADVDPATCTPRGPGHDSLCSTWQDPDWDPETAAVYYARVIENPSCRYTAWQCLGPWEGDRPASCDALGDSAIIQERAWSSPIWYHP